MRVCFWGTRGSVPTPGPSTTRFGGNTSCVEVLTADGTCLVLDCGTGARELGLALLAAGPPKIHLLLTHTHWDHIQGFPFFAPAYLPGATLNVYATSGLERTLEEALSGQMQHTYFPVRLSELRAQIAVHEVGEGTFRIGGVTVHTQYLNHTAPSMGYRVEAGGTCVVYATDHEPFWYQPSKATPGERLLHPGDRRHIEWLAGADLLIHDAQYADAEYPAKRNWGHSTVEFVTDMAIMAGVKRLVLFHHDPTRTDQMVSRFVQRMLRRARKQGSNLDIIAAAEGLVIELPETTMTLPPTPAGTRLVITAGCTVMLAGGDEEELAEVQRALEPDGYHFITAGPINRLGEEMVRGNPDLLVLASELEEGSTIELAHRLRADNPLGTIPIIILAREAGPDAARLLSLGIDIVLHPWSAPMLRARLRAWLTQSGLPQPEPTVRPNPRLLSTGQQMPTLFRGLPSRARALFLDSARPVHLPPGEVLVRQNQAASGVYLIRSGTVAISISGADGRQIHLGTAGPGEAIGELAAISGGHHSATVVATSQTVADYLPQDAFLAILVESPEAMLRLLRSLTMRLRASDMRVVELALPEFYNRVIQLLLEGSRNTPGPTGFNADSLARRMRADAEQVRSTVALLEAQGLVHTGRQGFEVLDPLGLLKLIGLDDAAGQES